MKDPFLSKNLDDILVENKIISSNYDGSEPVKTKLQQIKEIEEYVNKRISDKYNNLINFTNEGPSKLFLAEWGPGNEQRMIKTDGIPESPRAKRHYDRKCNTKNELNVLTSLPEPEMHNVIPIVDYYDAEGNSPAIIATRYYPHIKGLDVLTNKILEGTEEDFTQNEWEDIMSDVLHIAKYYKDNGQVHRDLKPSNILIKRFRREGKKRASAYVLDSANAGKLNKLTKKAMPTAGGHFILDPLLDSNLTGEEKAYTEQSELFALGVSARFVADKKYTWEFDPDIQTGKALDHINKKKNIFQKIDAKINELLPEKIKKYLYLTELTDENLVNKNGKINKNNYEQLNKISLSKIKSNLSKYSNFLYKLNTLDENKRFESIDEALIEFNKIKNKTTLKERLMNASKKTIIAGLIGLAGLSYGGKRAIDYFNSLTKKEMDVSVDGKNLSITNGFFDISVYAYTGIGKKHTVFPEKKFLKIERGKYIGGSVKGKQSPIGNNESIEQTMWPGAAYIEGYDKDEFQIYLKGVDGAESPYGMDHWQGHIQNNYFNINIPEDMPNGTYNLWIELYSPKKPDENERFVNNKKLLDYNIPEHGTIVSRMRIPLLLGDEEDNAYLSDIYLLPYSESIKVRKLSDDFVKYLSSSVTTELRIPSMNIFEETKHDGSKYDNSVRTVRFDPKDSVANTMNVEIVTKNNGRIINYNLVPIKEYKRTTEYEEGKFESMWTKLTVPDTNFYKQAIKFRQKLFSNQKSK